MPYIKQEDREKFTHLVKSMCLTKIENDGDLYLLLSGLVYCYIYPNDGYYAPIRPKGFHNSIKFKNLVKNINLSKIETAGELNYLTTHLIHSYLNQHPVSYQKYNDAMDVLETVKLDIHSSISYEQRKGVIGVLEGAVSELYRRYISKYENEKIDENGDVP